MDQTYHIVGGNGQTYGPVSLEKMLAWVREGRVVGDTYVYRGDLTEWLPAAQFAELGLVAQQAALTPASAPVRVVAAGAAAASAVPVPVAVQPAAAHAPAATGHASAPAPATVPRAAEALVPTIKGGAGWFYWIAGLSLINTILAFSSENGGGFLIGLGITQVIDGFARGFAQASGGGGAKFVALILDVVVYAVLIFIGVMAGKKHLWAFILGMVLYALDALIFLLFGDWLPLAFHGLALFFIFKGFTACREYRKLTA